MLSVASLLNPIKSDSRPSPSPCPSNISFSSTHTSPHLSPQTLPKKPKMTKDGAVFAKGKIKGDINFPPFEDLQDPTLLKELQKYQIYPLGNIRDYSRHIPYNSEKKTFLEKTGRESFEVFQYTFQVPGDEKEYVVMWDYNIGLVRITPFFKCCKYSKTTPARMLHLNPGLKNITHSITGGSLAAQGYWMPFSCAFAVCATFCDHISGALIPIFGSTFPSRCIPTSSSSFGRMVIEPTIIAAATKEANMFRQKYSTYGTGVLASPSISSLGSASPRETFRDADRSSMRATPELSRRLRLKRAFTNDGIYSDTDNFSDASMGSNERYLYTPLTPSSTSSPIASGWRPLNFSSATSAPRTALIERFETASRPRVPDPFGPNPWLSAVPRSGPGERESLWATRGEKIDEMHADEDYDGEESSNASGSEKSDGVDNVSVVGEMEKKAALLLMGLSVGDSNRSSTLAHPSCKDKWNDDNEYDGYNVRPRVKRRRAPSS